MTQNLSKIWGALYPAVRHLMNKLTVSVDKAQALVARLRTLPGQTASFVLHGQVANQLGQAVLSEFFVITLRWEDGGLATPPAKLAEFIDQHKLAGTLYPELITDEHLQHLQTLLPDALMFAQEFYMRPIQDKEALRRESQQREFATHLARWQKDAQQQLTIQFGEQTQTQFVIQRKGQAERQIQTILDESSQFYQNLTSLDNDAYLRVLSVFYNPL